jgi:hypothetical protein
MTHKGSFEANNTVSVDRRHRSDEMVVALLDAEAAKRGGRLVVEPVDVIEPDGRWRAGFVEPDDLGELVIREATYGPDPTTVMRELLERVAESPVDDPPAVDDHGFRKDDALLIVSEILGLELAAEIRLCPTYGHNGFRTIRVRVRCMPPDSVSAPIELAKVAARWDAEISVADGWFVFDQRSRHSDDERV